MQRERLFKKTANALQRRRWYCLSASLCEWECWGCGHKRWGRRECELFKSALLWWWWLSPRQLKLLLVALSRFQYYYSTLYQLPMCAGAKAKQLICSIRRKDGVQDHQRDESSCWRRRKSGREVIMRAVHSQSFRYRHHYHHHRLRHCRLF